MQITIVIDTDHEAFQENMNGETAKLLDKLSARLKRDEVDIHVDEKARLVDSLGNIVGYMRVTK